MLWLCEGKGGFSPAARPSTSCCSRSSSRLTRASRSSFASRSSRNVLKILMFDAALFWYGSS